MRNKSSIHSSLVRIGYYSRLPGTAVKRLFLKKRKVRCSEKKSLIKISAVLLRKALAALIPRYNHNSHTG